MKIIKYNTVKDIIIEFQDEYKTKVHTEYQHFVKGSVKNPYYPSICGVGIIGNKYPVDSTECSAWRSMINRCFSENYKKQYPTYKYAIVCDDWLLFENFYEWLHSQDNFNKWLNDGRWEVEKDILIKGNKIYSPETCCLVPPNVNVLFVKSNSIRGDLPIGVCKNKMGYQSYCSDPFINKLKYLGTYLTPEEAFRAYKQYKEYIIKQVAEIEYLKGNITKKCYEAMMNYEVEITD